MTDQKREPSLALILFVLLAIFALHAWAVATIPVEVRAHEWRQR